MLLTLAKLESKSFDVEYPSHPPLSKRIRGLENSFPDISATSLTPIGTRVEKSCRCYVSLETILRVGKNARKAYHG